MPLWSELLLACAAPILPLSSLPHAARGIDSARGSC